MKLNLTASILLKQMNALVDQLRVQEYGGNGVDVGHDYSMDPVVV